MDLQRLSKIIFPKGKSSSSTTIGAGTLYELGLNYEMGTGGFEKDINKALELFKESAQYNHIGAIGHLYNHFKKTNNKEEYEKLFVMYMKLVSSDPKDFKKNETESDSETKQSKEDESETKQSKEDSESDSESESDSDSDSEDTTKQSKEDDSDEDCLISVNYRNE
jgi:TPR repeat protein